MIPVLEKISGGEAVNSKAWVQRQKKKYHQNVFLLSAVIVDKSHQERKVRLGVYLEMKLER